LVFRAATQREPPQRCCHLQLLFWSDIGGTMPSKNKPFTPSSILFRPHRCRQIWLLPRLCGMWWRRRVPPPGPNGLLQLSFIAIVRMNWQGIY